MTIVPQPNIGGNYQPRVAIPAGVSGPDGTVRSYPVHADALDLLFERPQSPKYVIEQLRRHEAARRRDRLARPATKRETQGLRANAKRMLARLDRLEALSEAIAARLVAGGTR